MNAFCNDFGSNAYSDSVEKYLNRAQDPQRYPLAMDGNVVRAGTEGGESKRELQAQVTISTDLMGPPSAPQELSARIRIPRDHGGDRHLQFCAPSPLDFLRFLKWICPLCVQLF